MRLTRWQAQSKLSEIKIQLISARRTGNDNLAANLSQEKQKVKKFLNPGCLDCGAPTHGERCGMHARRQRYRSIAIGPTTKKYTNRNQNLPPSRLITTPSDFHKGIIAFAAIGMNAKQIANEVGKNKAAVAKQIQFLRMKLGLPTQAHLIRYAIFTGIVPNFIQPNLK